ncbi:terpene synthase [Umezawaea endophytica]|uniref:Terpene synthase n=1 Tax=Umezawaea endophytica TaxID=1654476 RepID=A0A9X2VVP9_9PSEU|nr:terpene synthase [Umezawaea endophytica]MCS7483820.1 terpene synthase [Umezawaea endophytica]
MTEWPQPRIWHLFPRRRNPLGDQAETHVRGWLDRYRLAEDPEDLIRLRHSRLGEAIAWSYPNASREVLELAADLLLWLLSFDDTHVEKATSDAAADVASRVAAFVDVLGHDGNSDGIGHEAALADLVGRARALLAPGQVARLLAAVHTTALAFLWQRIVRGKRVRLAEYNAMRPFSSLAAPLVVLIEPAAGLDLPDVVREDPDVRRVGHAARTLAGWINDLYSFAYEYDSTGEPPRTLPTLLAERNQCSLPKGFAEAVRMCEREARTAHALLVKLAGSGAPQAAVYSQAVRDNIASNEWWYTSDRYAAASTVLRPR